MSESEINGIFDWARTEIDSIETHAHGAKTKIIVELAKKLENVLQLESIAEEIVTQLQGKVGKSWVYEVLDDKYKNKVKQKAGEQSHKNSVPQVEQTVVEQPKQVIHTDGSTFAKQARDEIKEELETTLANERCRTAQLTQELTQQKQEWEQTRKELLQERSQPAEVSQLQEDVKKMQYEISQLHRLLSPFKTATRIEIRGQVIPIIVEVDPQSKRVLSVEVDEISARRMNQ